MQVRQADTEKAVVRPHILVEGHFADVDHRKEVPVRLKALHGHSRTLDSEVV